MAIFNSYEAVSLDLDLYAFVNKIPVHIATMGLGIPKVLNDRDAVYDGMSKCQRDRSVASASASA